MRVRGLADEIYFDEIFVSKAARIVTACANSNSGSPKKICPRIKARSAKQSAQSSTAAARFFSAKSRKFQSKKIFAALTSK